MNVEQRVQDAERRIDRIDRALNEERYRPGGWQKLVAVVRALPRAERRALESRISALSDKLHGRNRFPRVPFALAYAIEWCLLLGGFVLLRLGADSVLLSLAGVGALFLCMQPFIKVTTGLLLGLRYSYAYLWYVEPRFKMNYGSYLVLERGGRVAVQLAGSIGTPLAALVGYLQLGPAQTSLALLCLWLFWLLLLLQVATFFAEWFGVRKVGPFRLSLLTSPATAAMEWRDED